MPDFRVADTAPEHPKLRAAGLAAFGMWSAAGAWSMKELTDGWVPTYWVQSWPGGARAAATLVKVGLWLREERRGLPGFRFHDFFDHQRSAEQILTEREKGRARAAESRARSGERSGERRTKRSAERSGARNGERSAGVQSESHDSLPLSPEGGELGRKAPVGRRAGENGARDIPFPDGWVPNPGHRQKAARQSVNVEREAEQFEAHARSHDRRSADWDAAFTVWLGNASRTGGRDRNGSTSAAANTTDENIRALLAPGAQTAARRAIGGGQP